MTAAGKPERRQKPKAPAALAERVGNTKASAFPRAAFPEVEDDALREACLLAQDIALELRERMGALNWSRAELARQAGVQVDQVYNAADGTGWVALYTIVRLLQAVKQSELTVTRIRPPRPPRAPDVPS